VCVTHFVLHLDLVLLDAVFFGELLRVSDVLSLNNWMIDGSPDLGAREQMHRIVYQQKIGRSEFAAIEHLFLFSVRSLSPLVFRYVACCHIGYRVEKSRTRGAL
jgi:hypothetical protein